MDVAKEIELLLAKLSALCCKKVWGCKGQYDQYELNDMGVYFCNEASGIPLQAP